MSVSEILVVIQVSLLRFCVRQLLRHHSVSRVYALEVASLSRCRYLQGALSRLNAKDPTTMQHGPRIVNLLGSRLAESLLTSFDPVTNRSKINTLSYNRLIELNRSATRFVADAQPSKN